MEMPGSWRASPAPLVASEAAPPGTAVDPVAFQQFLNICSVAGLDASKVAKALGNNPLAVLTVAGFQPGMLQTLLLSRGFDLDQLAFANGSSDAGSSQPTTRPPSATR